MYHDNNEKSLFMAMEKIKKRLLLSHVILFSLFSFGLGDKSQCLSHARQVLYR